MMGAMLLKVQGSVGQTCLFWNVMGKILALLKSAGILPLTLVRPLLHVFFYISELNCSYLYINTFPFEGFMGNSSSLPLENIPLI